MSRRWRWLWVLALLSIAAARPGHGQWYSCAHQSACAGGYDEWIAGAGLNLISRGPWMAKGWRKPVVRLIWTTAASAFYERVIDWHGWENRDFLPRLGGYIVTEAIITIIRRKL